MAAIALSDCTVDHVFTNGLKMLKIVTPDTADDGDTIDVSGEFSDGCFYFQHGATDGTTTSADNDEGYSTTITLQGSTDDEARTIIAIGN